MYSFYIALSLSALITFTIGYTMGYARGRRDSGESAINRAYDLKNKEIESYGGRLVRIIKEDDNVN